MDGEKNKREPAEGSKKQYRGFEHRYRLYDRIKLPVKVFDIIIIACLVLLALAVIIGIFT